jgi:hypothetical protein
MGALLPILALALLATRAGGQDLPRDKEAAPGAEKPAARIDPAALARLFRQLGSADFTEREQASEQLARLDEVPDALRQAAQSADAEVARRARIAIEVVTARVEDRAFQAMVRDLHQVELDRFVRRMVTEEKFAGDKQWRLIQAVARAVTAEANRLGQRPFEVPDWDVSTMRRLLFNGQTQNFISVGGSVVLSAGPTPYINSVSKSLVIVDGDFMGATGIADSLLIVRGNVGPVNGVRRSIILATGNWEGATTCDNSFLQVNNQRIRFTGSKDTVLIKPLVLTTGDTNSQTLDAPRGPLQMLCFSPRNTDDQLDWGKDVNGLAVAITPAGLKDQFLIRWKNVGTKALGLPWVRWHSDLVNENADDLWDHVFLRGPDGKLIPARKHPAEPAARKPRWRRSIFLGPGQIHEERIDLWAYLERPAVDGLYQLSIELDIFEGGRGLDWEAKPWTGKIQSNRLAVRFGK